MSTTITIRAATALRSRLEERAAAAGTTLSAFIREILEKAVDERPLGRRAGHLQGRLTTHTNDEWADTIRKHNWRT